MEHDEAFFRDLLRTIDERTQAIHNELQAYDPQSILKGIQAYDPMVNLQAALDVDVIGPVLTALGIPDARLSQGSPQSPADADVEGSDTPLDGSGAAGGHMTCGHGHGLTVQQPQRMTRQQAATGTEHAHHGVVVGATRRDDCPVST